MSPYTILSPGDGLAAVAADGATLRLHTDGTLYRNGFKYVVRGVSLGAAKVGVYGQSLFALDGSGNLWLSSPTVGWVPQPDLSSIDPDFITAITSPNEPT